MDNHTFNASVAKTLTPLKSLSDAHLAELLSHCAPEFIFKGTKIFERGAKDLQHVFLLHGEVDLEDEGGEHQTLSGQTCLHALSPHQPRHESARAISDCSIVRIDSKILENLLTWSQIADYLLLDISHQRDLDEDVQWMMTVLRSNLFFKVPPTNVQKIFSHLTPKVVSSGDVILRQGEIGDGCYFIKEGSALVSQSPDGVKKPEVIATISEGRCFGEDALLNETVRNATVTMSENGVLMCLRKSDFIELLKEPLVETCERQQLESADEPFVYIDVRTEDEYSHGHLDSAVNIPLNLLRLKIRLLDTQQAYVLYCDSGRRSRAATWLLSQQGFNVRALDGGLQGAGKGGVQHLYQLCQQDYVLRSGIAVAGQ